MVKKKAKEAPENLAPEIEPAEAPVAEAPAEAPVAEAPVEVIPAAEPDEAPAPVNEIPNVPAADLSILPVQAVDYLKRHPEVDALYIDKFGGMVPKDTLKVFVKDAILYNNPYFKL